jgi:hypothetical protein
MAANTLSGMRVAILATDGVDQVERIEPRKALGLSRPRAHVCFSTRQR